ncbi:sensory box histidine kinase [Myxococcus stipitatus DSM 14675]|uniref:histidine kinase n=1 Tax=Myxococcus stipitatus (strain DSM 14675 / JCM 12634 / Mx s8) TaxID=1278073 RepID=L7U273_MYXSD|nr:PAS domain-containing sensor histidine kinase [Myxococcus stipitatus]AGC41905.1 sensory box histidine kinase [Myxococcus stipitatus DSM 14675]
MNPCSTLPGPLSDLLTARREDIARRWEAKAGRGRGNGLLGRNEQASRSLEWVDAVMDLLRLLTAVPEWEEVPGASPRGTRAHPEGADIAAVVREYGLLRDVLFEVLEESGWVLDIAQVRTLNRAVDVCIADAVARHARVREQTLRATEAQMQDILDHAPAAIYVKDELGRYVFVNRAHEDVIGMTRAEVMGRTDLDLYPREMAEVFVVNDRRVLLSGQPLESDERVWWKGEWRIFQSLKFPLLGDGGHARAVCGISSDVTQARGVQRERDEARERLRRIITALPVVLWTTDAEGRVTLVEGRGMRAMGKQPADFLGRDLREMYPTHPHLRETTRRALSGESFSTELELDGAWFMVYASPEVDATGRVVSVSGVSLDITERRRAEEVLRQSEMRYRLATQATRDVIYDWELATGHIEWSELAARQFRLPRDAPEMDIDWWTRSIHPEDRERVGQEMERIITSGDRQWHDEYRFRRGDGSWAVIEDRGHVVRDDTGTALRMVGAMHDVTERRAAEEEARRRAEFEQLLIGIVGHDLRNPLSAITMASTTLLRREYLDERQRKVIDRILSSAERATRMLRDVLDFTQARLGGGIPMQPQPLDLHELTRQVLDEVRLAHPERSLEFEFSGDGAGVWDPDRLAQVLTNLVNNALSYSPSECPVLVRTHGTHDAVTLSVHNMGVPIPAELLPRLFEPMKRAERRDPKEGRGLGLGLFIVKHIVDAHGGRLRVRSDEKEGTLFVVRLPRRLMVQALGMPGARGLDPWP